MATKTKAINLPKGISFESLTNKLKAEKKSAFEYQKRRHAQWDENYLLYRDRVQVNRLTQRQAVNIPLIKETIRTILPRVDEEPDITFEDKGGDLDKEIIINEKWAEDYNDSNMQLIDYVDKKQVLLYGRSYKKLNWKDGKFEGELKDIYDVLIDKKSSPLDIETARYIIEPHIFRSLEEISNNEDYDQTGREKLKEKLNGMDKASRSHRSQQNKEMAQAREKRIQQMNDGRSINGELEDFDSYNHVEELTQHYTHIWDKAQNKFIRYVVLVACDEIILRAEPLKEAIGVEFWPFEGWADDIEITDIWSDSIADMIRTPNQIINIWLSQLIENRTLRNFGMNFYDSTIEGFSPAQYQPRPGGWFPLPGKPAEVYQRVDIPDLTGTTNEIQFLIGIAEKASATGAVDKGVIESAKRTLGEIEIAVGKAEERTTSMSKFYRLSWKRYAEKWYAMNEANLKGKVKLYKKAPTGQLVGQEFSPEEIISEEGFKVVANSRGEKTNDKIDKIQRLMAVKQEFPDNPPLNKAIQKRLISLADLTPEEAQEIESYELQKIGSSITGEPGGAGVQNPAMAQIDALINGEENVQVPAMAQPV